MQPTPSVQSAPLPSTEGLELLLSSYDHSNTLISASHDSHGPPSDDATVSPNNSRVTSQDLSSQAYQNHQVTQVEPTALRRSSRHHKQLGWLQDYVASTATTPTLHHAMTAYIKPKFSAFLSAIITNTDLIFFKEAVQDLK